MFTLAEVAVEPMVLKALVVEETSMVQAVPQIQAVVVLETGVVVQVVQVVRVLLFFGIHLPELFRYQQGYHPRLKQLVRTRLPL
jgi:hypothetical protein